MRHSAFVVMILAAWLLSSCNIPTLPPQVDQVLATRTLTETPLVATDTPTPVPPTHAPSPSATVQPTSTSEPVELKTTPPLPSMDPLSWREQVIKEDTGTPPAVIEVVYPIFNDRTGSPVTGFNQRIEEVINEPLNYFRENVKNAEPMPDFQGKNGLYIDYEIRQNADGYAGVYFRISEYYQGAAHPSPFSATVNYDVLNNRVLQLSDLFEPGADYLTLISQLSIADLQRQGRLDWDTGAQAVEENFKSWNLTPEGLMITFDPYMVTAYAMGYQQVVLPWSSLAGILHPDFRLGK